MRALSQAQKLRTLLGGTPCFDDPVPARSKGMHVSTYDGIASRIIGYERAVSKYMLIALR